MQNSYTQYLEATYYTIWTQSLSVQLTNSTESIRGTWCCCEICEIMRQTILKVMVYQCIILSSVTLFHFFFLCAGLLRRMYTLLPSNLPRLSGYLL